MQELVDTFRYIAGQPFFGLLIKGSVALLLLFLGWRFAKALVRAESRLLVDAHIDAVVVKFLRNTTYALLLAFAVVAGLEIAGFPINSLLTLLGAMAFAVGLSLKDSLSHVAAGLILMVLRPFRIGDRVNLAGQDGVVEDGLVFQTQLRGADNSVIVLMNGSVMAAPIINYSRCDARRMTLSLNLPQGTDLAHALKLASDTLTADARLANKPPVELLVTGLGTSNVGLVVHAWASESSADAICSDLRRAMQGAFQQAQIGLDVTSSP
jgi:small conductance mechanosensitive channel